MEKRTLIIIFATLLLFAVGGLGAYLTMKQEGDKELVKDLMLSDYPEVFGIGTVIIVGEEASEVEREAAGLIAADLEELTGNRPEIISTKDVQNYKSTHNLIIVGTPNSNPLLREIYYLTGAKEVTDKNPGEGKGIVEILRNPWNLQKALILVEGINEQDLKKSAALLMDQEILKDFSTTRIVVGPSIKLIGRIYVTGHEPFSQLAIESQYGVYLLIGPQAAKGSQLWHLQNEDVEVEGVIIEGPIPPSFAAEKGLIVRHFRGG